MKIDFKLNEKCGVYKIINNYTGEFYVGSSKNIYDRLHLHFFKLKNKKHHNQHLQNSFNKHGYNVFDYEILEFCNIDQQYLKEQYYISLLKPKYNKTLNVIANIGSSPSINTRVKISNTLKTKYKNGEIKTYKQKHLWETLFVYDIYTFELAKICKNLKECFDYFNVKNSSKIDTKIIKGRFVISKKRFRNQLKLKNWIYKNHFLRKNKYIISECDNVIKYYPSINLLCLNIGLSKNTFIKE